MRHRPLVPPALAAGLFAILATTARAEVTDCTPITSLPVTITSPGIYCLTGSLTYASNGNAITFLGGLTGSVLDLNGHTLDGGVNGNASTGVAVEGGSKVVIRNGSITRFGRGVHLTSTSVFSRVEGLRISGLTIGPGIESGGNGNVIQGNWIGNHSTAILSSGQDVRIRDNDVIFNVVVGIDVTAGWRPMIENNRISRSGGATAGSVGIRNTNGTISLVTGNRVMGYETGFQLGVGTKYRENLTASCTTGYVGGTNAGNNY